MNLQAAAADFLSTTELASWEPGHRTRAVSLLQHVSAGQLDASDLRTALGAAPRTAAAGPPSRSIAVLRLYGVLTPGESLFSLFGAGTSLREFGKDLGVAVADPSITRIAVLCDSPGGLIALVPETADLMRRARAKKPVTIAVSGMCCSAAYWIAANSTKLEATSSARIGSIGVYGVRASIVRQLDREGVDIEVISAGRFKTEGLPITAITDEERRATQADVDEAYSQFVTDVSLGRGIAASSIRAGFGQGRCVSATEALRQGMIDRVDLVESTVARAASAPDIAARAMAWQRDIEAQLFELQLPPWTAAAAQRTARQQWEEERLMIELALL